MDAKTPMLARAVKADKSAKRDGGPLRVFGAAVGAEFVLGAHLKIAKDLFGGIHEWLRREGDGEGRTISQSS